MEWAINAAEKGMDGATNTVFPWTPTFEGPQIMGQEISQSPTALPTK